MPRNRANRAGEKARHDPLATQLRKDEILVDDEEAAATGGGTGDAKATRKRRKRRIRKKEAANETNESYVEEALAKRIMKQAEDQRREEEMEQMQRGSSAAIEFPEDPLPEPKMFAYESDGEDSVFSEDEDNYLNDVDKLSPADERLLSMFTAGSSGARATPARNLADIIEARLREREGAITLGGSAVDVGERLGASLPKKVVKAYRIVGRVLKDYRSGKLPKAFKIIPALENWEDIVFITNPSEWSKHAMYQAVKVFASNLNAKMAQRFFNLVLLPCVREDISEHRKLNFHLYQALRKALYKPAAFYKGFLLPLLEEGCSVREALIVASVVKKSRIPMLHSAAAMLRMMELPYSGPVTIMLHTLVDKSTPSRSV
ncbi:bystin [Thecamonas trahens ATCC 50062]|uniref:Bystin n=1 Tax=Thecamonas trahens ATCC 50062 TaxID=461836 RepID=A0A0L0DIL9_THETB|nr:bystin [Thecamonas trahens ATCC 50062]KNC52229.1 bystin [Thecamonas trahens ATCC 50062]|eukprot:XP_013762231.1 bystin [Thecamonas trahens ATCC 50062]